MATDKVPFTTKPTWAVDPMGKSLLGDTMVNCVLRGTEDGLMLRKRPGAANFAPVSTDESPNGIYWWQGAGKLIVGTIFHLLEVRDPAVGLPTEQYTLADDASAPLAWTFAEGQQLDGTPILYACCGAELVYSTGSTFTAATGAPEAVSAVAYLHGRFICNEVGTNRVYFTDSNPATGLMDVTYWLAVDNPLTADSHPDGVTALVSIGDVLGVWGKAGMEFWQDDGATPFSPIPGSFLDAGLVSAGTVVKTSDSTVVALVRSGGVKQVVKIEGRQLTPLSRDIRPLLNDADNNAVNMIYAAGTLINTAGGSYYKLEGAMIDGLTAQPITMAYDLELGYWLLWDSPATWAVNTDWDLDSGDTACLALNRGGPLGLLSVSDDTATDAGLVATPGVRRTGWLDHGSLRKKVASEMRLRLKRGMTGASCSLRYRDDGSQTWKASRTIDLGTTGPPMLAKMRNLGQYQTRQYEITMDGTHDFLLVAAEVDVA
jgi:hypothetical protein